MRVGLALTAAAFTGAEFSHQQHFFVPREPVPIVRSVSAEELAYSQAPIQRIPTPTPPSRVAVKNREPTEREESTGREEQFRRTREEHDHPSVGRYKLKGDEGRRLPNESGGLKVGRNRGRPQIRRTPRQ